MVGQDSTLLTDFAFGAIGLQIAALPVMPAARLTPSPHPRGPSRMYGYKFRPAGLGIAK